MIFLFSHAYRQAGTSNFKLLIAVLIFLMVSGALIANSQAAPEFLITWKANSYVPSEYQGKALPIADSIINIGLDLMVGGKIVDLSKNQVQWTLNGKLTDSGLGLKNLNVRLNKLSNTNLNLIIKINYKGSELNKFVVIPVAEPEVVIKTINKSTLKANPYFFNVQNLNQLSFNWSVNNQKPVGKPKLPNILEIEGVNLMPTESIIKNRVDIETTIINLENQLEKAVGRLFLKI